MRASPRAPWAQAARPWASSSSRGAGPGRQAVAPPAAAVATAEATAEATAHSQHGRAISDPFRELRTQPHSVRATPPLPRPRAGGAGSRAGLVRARVRVSPGEPPRRGEPSESRRVEPSRAELLGWRRLALAAAAGSRGAQQRGDATRRQRDPTRRTASGAEASRGSGGYRATLSSPSAAPTRAPPRPATLGAAAA